MISANRKKRGVRRVDPTRGQERLLSFLYGTALGRLLLKPLVRPAISQWGGRLLSCGWSRVLIAPFVKKNGIDMSQFQQENYRSYNEFFSRRIRPERRPMETDEKCLISPCDSKLTALPITSERRFTLKHTEYSVASLLANETLAASYEGGMALVFRLTVDDYHRYCYIDDGEKGENIRIPGVFHTVNPIANDVTPIYKQNTREYSVLRSEHFGDVIMMEVGALLVGKIVNHHGRSVVRRGQEKGFFQFGGSTIVLLFQKDKVQIDEEILKNSREGLETVVRYRESIGRQA